MLDDPELERLHAERLAELRAEAERRTAEPAQPLYGERADAGHLLNGSGVDGLISGSDCVPAYVLSLAMLLEVWKYFMV